LSPGGSGCKYYFSPEEEEEEEEEGRKLSGGILVLTSCKYVGLLLLPC